MDNLFSYLKWRGDLEFSCLPFNIEDQLILSTLIYVNFGPFIKEGECLTIKEASERVLAVPYKAENFRVKNDFKLLEAIVKAPRFSSLYISDVEEHFDTGSRQFFAFTVHLKRAKLIVFRGTDNTVTGWKEDFAMAYEDEVPSQRDALKYLMRVARRYRGSLVIAGHSKGGNLAVYAAVNASDVVKKRILKVYNNDGPGFNEHNRTCQMVHGMDDRIVTIVPSSSIIGMLMCHSSDYLVVDSSARLIFQHDPYSWVFDGPCFKYLPERSQDSIVFESVISSWLKDASRKEREVFVDAAYKCFSAMGIDSFAGNSLEILFRAPEMIKQYKALSNDEKKVMKKLISGLIRATRTNLVTKE